MEKETDVGGTTQELEFESEFSRRRFFQAGVGVGVSEVR